MVPVPYSITAKQGDDANTAATVRFTKKRAHNMASLITKCTGDQPGTGTGIKSGTTGAACHPKTHSGSVRVKGEWAIRHNDTWEMNNRNTLGKLTYIKSTEAFEETPAILLTQNPQDEAPSELIVSDTVAAILSGMERARQEGLPEGSYQVAQALEVMPDVPHGPGTPNVTPDTRVPQPTGPAANDNVRPTENRIARQPAQARPSLSDLLRQRGTPAAGARGLGLAGAALALAPIGLQNLMSRDAGRLQRDHDIILDPNDPFDSVILEEYTNNRGPSELSRLYRGMDEEEAVAIVRERVAEAEGLRQQEAVQAQVTAGNVRVEADEEDRTGRECLVGEYRDIVNDCDGEAHHIVPDMAYRLGRRPEGSANSSTADRIPSAPTLDQGMAICLTPAQHGSGPTGIHGRLRGQLNALGAASPVAGTAPMGQILAASLAEIIAIPDIPPECKALAAARATEQVENGTGFAAPGRTRESPLPSGDAERVLRAGTYN